MPRVTTRTVPRSACIRCADVERQVAHGRGSRAPRVVAAEDGPSDRPTARRAPKIKDALAALTRDLAARFRDRVREVRLFGSVARGEADDRSDVDVLVVLDEIRSHAEGVAPMELAADAGLPRGLVVQALVLSEDELAYQRQCETELAAALDRDGVVV